MGTDTAGRGFDLALINGARRTSPPPDSTRIRLHGRFYRAILWNMNLAAVEAPPRHLVDRRV